MRVRVNFNYCYTDSTQHFVFTSACLSVHGTSRTDPGVSHHGGSNRPRFEPLQDLYDRSIGTESPLYGSACERLSRALVHAQRHQEGEEAKVKGCSPFNMFAG